MRKNAVIVAGGSGTRMGGGLPKQFRNLCGRPVVWWSVKAVHQEDPSSRIILVLPEDFVGWWEDFISNLPDNEKIDVIVTTGGSTRSESVMKGLAQIDDGKDSLVAVHDGARPLINVRMLAEGWNKAEIYDAAIPVVPVTDSLRKVEGEESKSVDRSAYVAVQTPQVFKTELLKEAYRKAEGKTFTDDAAVMEHAGHRIELYEGSPENIKITNPKDMAIAAVIMGENA